MSHSRTHPPELVTVSYMVAIAMAVTTTVLWRVDADLWGHLRFGLDIFRGRSIAAADPYSFTSDTPWINHEWLSEAVMGMAFAMGETPALLVMKASVVGSAYALMALRLRHVGAPARYALLSVVIFATMPLTTTLRPQVWTVLAITILTATIAWPISRLWMVWPVMFAVWANMHGGWIVGLGIISTWGFGTAIDRRDWRVLVEYGALGSACLLATLCTPYGLDLWRFLWSTVGFDRPHIVEWQSVWRIAHPVVWIFWTISAATALVIFQRTSWAWAVALPVLLMAVSSLKVIRLIGLFGIVVVMLAGVRLRSAPAPRLSAAVLACSWLMATLPAAFLVRQQLGCLPISDPDYSAAGAFRSAQPGRLVVPFNWGQYAIWHFGPKLKVSMDGRRETVYSQARIEQIDFGRGNKNVLALIQEEQPEYIWIPTADTSLREGLMDRYRRDVETDRSIILVRADLPKLIPASLSPCFP